MKAITYTAARQNLAKTMEQVCRDHSPVIITRKTGDSVVLLSLEDYTALEETAYLLRSPKNTRRLIESITQLEDETSSQEMGHAADPELFRHCCIYA
ncbi:type II toxin-antitoxin system Phd/YefM family antitoxin [Desulfococcus sp.]|uniref:type II toxin-antitoxin system Phd/YefM family antitoxin n=1 Tax=Desulfococcus sp. TaxID=2025834 RepID=UPI0035939B28